MSKAYLFISCESGSDNFVISTLKKMDCVKEAFGTFGPYDVITKIESDTDSGLKEIITKNIRTIPKIHGTLTLMAENNIRFGKKLSHQEKETLAKHSTQAYIAMNCKRSKENEVLSSLAKIPEVIDGDMVIGSYDLLCKVSAPTYNDISEVVSKKIRKLENVRSTITLNLLP